MDGDTDREDGGDAEPSLGAPEGHVSQIVWLRGANNDQAADETPVEDPWASAPVWYRAKPVRWILTRAGHDPRNGNILTAAGATVFYTYRVRRKLVSRLSAILAPERAC